MARKKKQETSSAGRGRPKGSKNMSKKNRIVFSIEKNGKNNMGEYTVHVNGGRLSYMERTCIIRIYRKHLSEENTMAIAYAVLKSLNELDLKDTHTPGKDNATDNP